ncbi:MAG: RIP metalloprotease RseP [Mariprofundales bacterium]|nr:RIP metalloprotease RseP [Mariprofundales bacterium]
MIHTLLFFLLAIALLVTVHEYGHFITARKLGIKVEKFSIGFGPALYSWRGRDGEVEYVIAAIPLGGYVKMLGENPAEQGEEAKLELSPAERARAFDAQPVWKRAAVAVAGPMFNFLFAIVIYMVIGWLGQQVLPAQIGVVQPHSVAQHAGLMVGDRVVQVDGRAIHSWHGLELLLKEKVGAATTFTVQRGGTEQSFKLFLPQGKQDALLINVANQVVGIGLAVQVMIDGVLPGKPAAMAGLRQGDQVLAVGGLPVRDLHTLVDAIHRAGTNPVQLALLRAGKRVEVSVNPSLGTDGVARIGVRLMLQSEAKPERYRMGFMAGVGYGFQQTWDVTVLTWQVFTKMVSAVISPDNLGGPIAIAQMAGKSATLGLVPFLAFLALISVNLGVLNLLPIPVLDGGQLLYLIAEKLRGRALPVVVLEKVQMVGVVLIGALMLFAFYNDIARWLRG